MPELKHHPDAPPPFEEPVCVEQSDYPSVAVFFLPQDGREYGFLYAHVAFYHLESNPDRKKINGDAPPDRVTIIFPSHEIVLSGWRLNKIRKLFSAGRVTAFITADGRHVAMGGEQPLIAEITITAKVAS